MKFKNTCYTVFSFTYPFHNFTYLVLGGRGGVNKVKGRSRFGFYEKFFIYSGGWGEGGEGVLVNGNGW